MKKEKRIAIFLGLEKCKNILEELDYWIHEHIYIPIRHAVDVIKANIDILYFINKNGVWYDWDFGYMLMLLDYKIKKMRNCFKEEGLVADEDLNKMLTSLDDASEQIRRYINNNEIYEDEHPLPFKIGYRFESTEDGKGSYMISVNEDEHRDLTDEEEDIHLEWLKAMYENENKEWDAIWDIIKEHGRSWWS